MDNVIRDKSGRDITNVKKWMDAKPYGKANGFVEWTITPAMAQSLLDSMVRNRAVTWGDVRRYAEDMKRGYWHKETSCISLDCDGRLLDGQHRMLAIIEADMPVVMRVQLNVPPDTPFDSGKKRTAADNAYMTGAVSRELATNVNFAVVNRVLSGIYGEHKAREFTINDKTLFMQLYGDEIALAVDISSHGSTSAIGKNACVQSALFAASYSGVPEDLLRRFAVVVNSGLPDGREEWAAVMLHGALEKTKGLSTYSAKQQKASWTEQAIKDFADGTPRQRIYRSLQFPYLEQIADEIKGVLA